MRIGVDYFGFNPALPGGMHNFALGLTKGLLNNLAPHDSVVIITSGENHAEMRTLLADLAVTFTTVALGKRNKYVNWALWVFAWAIRSFKLRSRWDRVIRSRAMAIVDESVDVLIIPTAILNFYALHIPTILCVHDIQQEYHPELFSPWRRIIRWGSYRASCWKASAVQASSEYIRDCLTEKFAFLEPGKIFIAHEGVDLIDFSPAVQGVRPDGLGDWQPGDFVFYPAQLWTHKNHLLLIDALAIHRDRTATEMPCVLTGHDYGYWSTVQERIRKHDLRCVRFLGRVTFPQLQWLYGNCRAVLALGFHESSSLPVREGAAFGKPLLCANIPPNVEAQSFLCLRLVDKDDPTGLADAFGELTDRDGLLFSQSRQNKNLVKVFDWASIAKTYISVAQSLTS